MNNTKRFLTRTNVANLTGIAMLATSLGAGAATMSFRDNVNILLNGIDTGIGYTDVHDAELREVDPNLNFDTGTGGGSSTTNFELRIDGNSGGGEAHAVMRFDNIFGAGPGQIAYGATINSATLFFDIDNRGDDVELFDLLFDFGDESTVTWNSTGGGIRTSGGSANALSTPTATIDGQGNFTNVDVTSSVAAWSAGIRDNFGWGFISTGNDGIEIDASELMVFSNAPMLTIDFTVPPAPVPLPPSAWMLLSAIGFTYGIHRQTRTPAAQVA